MIIIPNGCKNPAAINYDPSAAIEDYSCRYLEKSAEDCYLFEDVLPEDIADKSYTLSYSLLQGDFVFYHDYVPDFYFEARNKLFNLKDGNIYRHHEGPPGRYYTADPKSFLVDFVFTAQEEMILNAVKWMGEMAGTFNEFNTCTHITVWNAQQCSGRIPIIQQTDGLEFEQRKTQGVWSFNTFRDQLLVYGTAFLQDIFNNFAVIDAAVGEKPWFDTDLLHDNWFVIRLEYDNVSGKQFLLHDVDLDVTKSYR